MTDFFVRAIYPTRRKLLVLICVGSFLFYALAALTLHQELADGWGIEAAGPIPSALSHLLYGTPLGAADSNLLMKLSYPQGARVQDIITAAVAGSIPRGETIMYTLDGGGAGENIFATLAMWLFGPRIASLIYLYLVFVGISVLVFVCRYRDRRLLVVPLYFLALTIMLLTPLSASPHDVVGGGIGGMRYFVLAAFLPALHIYFELLDRSDPTERRARIFYFILLFIQGILLFAALLARSSTSYLLGILLVALAWRFYRDRGAHHLLIELGGKSATVAAALVLWTVFIVTAMPTYVHTGRALGNFWHRAFISFGAHPEWPFGDLREVYDCTRDIPEGLTPGQSDRTGHCIWLAYPPNKVRPLGEVIREVYDGNYERVVRNALLYVAAHYPRQTFELYFRIKPRQIEATLADAWTFLLQLPQAPVVGLMFFLLVGQCVSFVIFVIAVAFADGAPVTRPMIVFPLMFLFSLGPRFVAWGGWGVSADLIFLMYSCLILAFVFALQLAFLSMRNVRSAQLRSAWNSPRSEQ